LADQLQHPPVRDALLQQIHQVLSLNAVEVALNVGIDDKVQSPVACFPDRFQGLGRALLRPESITARLEVRLEDRLDHQLRRHLHHSIPYRRDGRFIMHLPQ